VPLSVEDQVVEFFNILFGRLFSGPFGDKIDGLMKRRAMIRQIEGAADAASQSLTRFFINQKFTEKHVSHIIRGLEIPTGKIEFGHIISPYDTPETYVNKLLTGLSCPDEVRQAGHEAIYRVALHSIVQVLMLVGPVMAEWQKLDFSSTFELLQRIVNRLNRISKQMNVLAISGQDAADERFELTYRDYLLQRFHRVEAGTVRMTTNLDIDLRELFVMPRALERPKQRAQEKNEPQDGTAFMNLSAARKMLAAKDETSKRALIGLAQIRRNPRNVIVGAPGSGKSTLLEWLHVKLAGVEEEFVMAGQQAIPLLLRVRQLDVQRPPRGPSLIEKATASKDITALMPDRWVYRQMKSGRILFMLDGLDETDPDLRDKHLIPWLEKLCEDYPKCHYLVTSRPVGYPPGSLRSMGFVECDLLDFEESQIREYTRNWSTAVRLAQNEPDEEARREGKLDGDRIAESFMGHQYISNLARNPLMLSAICLVNHFEGGQLPEDRAMVYRLCVEGLLHNWDQRRGIHSTYSFNDKLRVCREVALAMQADDLAEYESDKILEILTLVLDDPVKAENLLEHIRYRTGLLVERRLGVFAFAHLTFQEYLTARAVHEGNRRGIDIERLAREVNDGRWQEVIPLYCGLAPAPDTRRMIESLISQPYIDEDSKVGLVLAEAFLASGPEILGDEELRQKVFYRIASSPHGRWEVIDKFPENEFAEAANLALGTLKYKSTSFSCEWLVVNPEQIDWKLLMDKLQGWRELTPFQIAEMFHLIHSEGSDMLLTEVATWNDLYAAPGPKFPQVEYAFQAEVAFAALAHSDHRRFLRGSNKQGLEKALLSILTILADRRNKLSRRFLVDELVLGIFKYFREHRYIPRNINACRKFVSVARKLAERLLEPELEKNKKLSTQQISRARKDVVELLAWADLLESSIKDAKTSLKSDRKAEGR